MNKSLINTLFFIAPFLLCPFLLAGQSAAAVNKIGDESRRGASPAMMKRAAEKSSLQGDHLSSLKYWELYLQADTTADALANYAAAAYQLQNFEKTDSAYQKLVRMPAAPLSHAQIFQWADTKYRLRDFAAAEQLYRQVLEKKGAPTADLDAAQAGIEQITWALKHGEAFGKGFSLEKLPAQVNSAAAEYALGLRGDTLLFTTFHATLLKDKHYPPRSQGKVRMMLPGDTPLVADADVNDPQKITAHIAYNRLGNVRYFTRCEYIKTAEIQCQIYMQQRDATGNWSTAVRLPETINTSGYTTTEPHVAWDKEGKQEILFFASDRPNGKGKRDLYYSLILGEGGFSEPVNLRDLNTEGDDVTPFYHQPTGTLYFSSDGYQTLGGKDIFRSRGFGLKWSAVEHIGLPANSAYDDVCYILSDDGKTAYFSSNRIEAKDQNEEYCCPDIFKIDYRKPEIIAVSFNKLTGDTLTGTTLNLFYLTDNEEFTFNSPRTWAELPASPGKRMMLISSKEGFRSDTLIFTTPPQNWTELLVQKLYLEPERIQLVASVYDIRDGAEIRGATCQFIDLGRVLPGGAWVSGKDGSFLMTKTDTDPTGNTYRYGLDYNHRYRIIVSKDGYTMDSVEVSTEGMSGSSTIYRKLYLGRGINLIANAYDAYTRQPLHGTTIRFFELPTASRFETSTNEISHFYKYGLDFEKRYRIIITKSGYLPDSLEFSTTHLSHLAFSTITKDLYLKPYNLRDYLPLTVYFDNDEPDKRTLRTTTMRTYESTYFDYIARRPAFIAGYLSDRKNPQQQVSDQQKIEQFFEEKVKAGYTNLMNFSEVLLLHLQKGETINIQISGFASPRAKNDYNKNLTSRRIWSLRNHFSQFKGGVIKKYLSNGQLLITELPQGEDTAQHKGISDVITDLKNSVYSVEASLERRVEIQNIEVIK